MGRAQRRRAEREQRRHAGPPAQDGAGQGRTPPTGRFTSTQVLTSPDDVARHKQEFLAGTVFAAGAGIVIPDQRHAGQLPTLAPMFTVFVNEDDSTFRPAPQLRKGFRLLDLHGAVALNKMLTVATSWAAIDTPEGPLVKLKLEFHKPITGNTAIVLIANNYPDRWEHILDGGIIAITSIDRLNRDITSIDRLNRDASTPTASFADAMEASILLGIDTSPGIKYLMDVHGW